MERRRNAVSRARRRFSRSRRTKTLVRGQRTVRLTGRELARSSSSSGGRLYSHRRATIVNRSPARKTSRNCRPAVSVSPRTVMRPPKYGSHSYASAEGTRRLRRYTSRGTRHTSRNHGPCAYHACYHARGYAAAGSVYLFRRCGERSDGGRRNVHGRRAAGQWRAAILLSTVDMLFSNR